jgi:hypothetical protein
MGANVQGQYKLNVNLGKMTYAPGELLSGTFSFLYDNDKAKKKNIKIKNPAVNISIIQTETINNNSKPISKQNTLINQSMNINQLLDINKNPDGIFTFQMQVPLNAQPSFEWPHSEKINASLRSVIQVEIKDVKASGTSFLIIKKNSTPLNSPLEIIEKSHKKGIFTGGDVLLRINFQTNTFPIYSQVPLQFTIDFSQSKYKIKGVNCTFKRKVKLFDNKGGVLQEFIDELEEKNVKGNMTKVQTENFLMDLRDPVEVHKNYCMKILGMANGLQPNQLITLMPSLKGTLFSCEYYFKCKAIIDTPLLSAINSPFLYGAIDVFSPLDNDISNVTINPDMLPTLEEVEAQGNLSQRQNSLQQTYPPKQQFLPQQIPPQYPPQQQYLQQLQNPPQQIPPQYPPQQQYPQQLQNPPQQSYPSQQPYPSQIQPQIISPSQPQQQYIPQQEYPPQNQVAPQQSHPVEFDNLPDAKPASDNNQYPSF